MLRFKMLMEILVLGTRQIHQSVPLEHVLEQSQLIQMLIVMLGKRDANRIYPQIALRHLALMLQLQLQLTQHAKHLEKDV